MTAFRQVETGYCLVHLSIFVPSTLAVLFYRWLLTMISVFLSRVLLYDEYHDLLALNFSILHFIHLFTEKCNQAPYYIAALFKVKGNQ